MTPNDDRIYPLNQQVPGFLKLARGDVWLGVFKQGRIHSQEVDEKDNHLDAHFDFTVALHGVVVGGWCAVRQVSGSAVRGDLRLVIDEISFGIRPHIDSEGLRNAAEAYSLALVGPAGEFANLTTNTAATIRHAEMIMPFPFQCAAIP